MKKSKSTPRVATDEPAKLTHSPFAALGAPGAPREAEPAPPVAVPPQPSAASGPGAGAASKSRGRLVLRRETKHRGGKAVVIVSGFAELSNFDQAEIEALARLCKQTLGCGGTVDGGEIVVQGDRPAEVAEILRAQGFRVGGVTS